MMNLLGNQRNREDASKRRAFAARVVVFGTTILFGAFMIAAIVSCEEI